MDPEQASKAVASADPVKRWPRFIVAFVVRFALEFVGVILIAELYIDTLPCLSTISHVHSIRDAAICALSPIVYVQYFGLFFAMSYYLVPFSALALGLTAWWVEKGGLSGHTRPTGSDQAGRGTAKPAVSAKRWRARRLAGRFAFELAAVIAISKLYYPLGLCLRYIASLHSVRDALSCIASPSAYLGEYGPFEQPVHYALPLLLLAAGLIIWGARTRRKGRPFAST